MRRALLALVLLALVGGGVAIALAVWPRASEPPITGVSVDRAVPSVPLLTETGKTTTLAAYRGKVVVVAPFLTLCHEVCPLTTGAFLQMQRATREAGLGDRVVFVEVSVDPWRDSPARLRAFKRLTGAELPMLTGTRAALTRFWRFFGVAFYKTPASSPPDVDWWTHEPQRFDVGHTDGLFLVDERVHERIAIVGMADVGGRLPAVLKRLLNETGRENLSRPQAPWTIPQALDDLGTLLGRRIPPPASS